MVPSENCTERCTTYGKIHVCIEKTIGNGSTGVVYKGYFESADTPVAVKIITKANINTFQKELDTFRELTTNRNVSGAEHLVRYYGMEETPGQFILAMELCDTDLEHFVNSEVVKIDPIKLINGICRGLSIMHMPSGATLKPIVHRDIKPSNVLLKKNEDGSYTAKLADFGISKKLHNHHSATTRASGTSEWMSPACLRAIDGNIKFKASTKDDIFSLGMLIYYIYSWGRHPFGDHSHRTYNIRHNRTIIDDSVEENFAFQNLVRAMIQNEPKRRPNIEQVLNHPFFWTPDFCLDFIIDVYNVIDSVDNFRTLLESLFKFMNDFRGGWCNSLDVQWTDYIQKQKLTRRNAKRYQYESFASLLAFIRDKFEHRKEWAEEKNLVPLLRNGERGYVDGLSYMRYFINKFPKLVLVLSTTSGIESLPLNPKFHLPSQDIFQLGPIDEGTCSMRKILEQEPSI